ncbi:MULTISPECIES: tRNA adenosine(34) deaminase TadA [Ligilactobacillus]|jgi:tRNA(adenine34) deaminase|uniref:tRNA-specific adenosine deaminase n=4 Tax=Ligilactobacillus TaxID=2767887 RepID=A0A2Z4W0V9_9LACO|nr:MULTISPECIES: tRNA adenosine(34) deaminase TadA [Ligilactobacillus]NBH86323.1 nucleoside deaminase [Lachnospiraceae bacterium]HAB49714.1 nucleoside deaminase [Lactobacillus sp.]AWZ37658.1 nucleoside deaminase [Ligilactobacillus murinus]AWZ41352.1 nucleoside deaminase [Ligilactobacillus murinus]KRM58300.1 cytosine adenosine deaminase [Ligilactobacillus animalis KCTC 3501 = DSM 20602]
MKREEFMQAALAEAKKAQALGEVPIGCVIVHQGQIIGRGHNLRETTQQAEKHAEMIAIAQANQVLDSWRLPEAELYVTLEPCPMCSGAIINSRIAKVYYGAADEKAGTAGTLMNLLTDPRFNHQVKVQKGLLQAECAQILSDFFANLRKK